MLPPKGFAFYNGDLWPEGDTQCKESAYHTYMDLDKAIKFCKEKRIAIQAGGNCGIWPRYLVKHFKWVYTFEPDANNFRCLVYNAPDKNIIKMQAVLGNERKPVALNISGENIGSHHVTPGKKAGVIPQIEIDVLNLPACDLIQLDVEGFELHALLGAACTINKYSPVIMLENKGHEKRYGAKAGDAVKYLEDFGYKIRAKVSRDIILIRE